MKIVDDRFHHWIFLLLLMLCLAPKGVADVVTTPQPAASHDGRKIIKVGGYSFPPFVELDGKEVSGVTVDLIDVFNELQQDYRFQFVATSPKRRYTDMMDGRFQVMFFESADWGWHDFPVMSSHEYMRGGEVYVALKKSGRDDTFFDDLKARHLVGILGYHYGFANFNADDDYLSKNFTIFLSNNHRRNLDLILLDRPALAEIAVVTRSFLSRQMLQDPTLEERLLISSKWDQEYHHTVLVRSDPEGITLEEVNTLLERAEAQGALSRLRKKYGITDKKSFDISS